MVIAGQMWIGSNDSLSLQEDPGALFLTGLQLLIGLKQYFLNSFKQKTPVVGILFH